MGLCNQVAITFFFLLLSAAWAFTVAALVLPNWVSSLSYDVGVFKYCYTINTKVDCGDIRPGRVANKTWLAAGSLIMVGLLFLGFTILMAFASLFSYRYIKGAKFLMGFADLFIVLGIVLVPIGYKFLGDECSTPDDRNSCGLGCNGSNSFGYFTLCDPFKIGTAMYLLIVGIICLFIASLVSSCVRSKTKYYEP
eukprot:m.24161 g.24161  ORF g.24161 m.24161 type:complete len:195 (+) comp35883_c0_seq2:81-665(+)